MMVAWICSIRDMGKRHVKGWWERAVSSEGVEESKKTGGGDVV